MSERPLNILLTSAGRRVALLHAFQDTLKQLNLNGKVFAADCSEHSAAYHAADKGFTVPRVTAPGYLDELLSICKKQQIRILVPLIDTELLLLSQNKAKFEQLGTEVVISGPDTISITRDKNKTFQHFVENQIPTPKLLSLEQVKTNKHFPVFLKPADGSRSQGSHRIDSLDAFNYWLPQIPNPIVLEYLEGSEYTIDTYVTASGEAKIAVPRLREEVRDGEISKGRTVQDDQLIQGAIKVAQSLPDARGVLTIQCRKKEGAPPMFFEVNARFGGGAPLSIHAGANFPSWIVQEHLGQAITKFHFEPNWQMFRYDEAVWVHP